MSVAPPRPERAVEKNRSTRHLLERASLEGDDRRRQDLLNEVVVINLPMALSIARRFRGRGCALEDLEQAASLALVRAVRAYEPARGDSLLTYAVPCVTGAVKRHFRDHGWMVRPPRAVQDLQPRVEAERHVLDPVTGVAPTSAVIAGRLDVSLSDVDKALAARGCFAPTSLDAEVGTDGSTLGDLLVAEADQGVAAAEARVALEPVLARLEPDDRLVLRLHFAQGMTQTAIGRELGLSQPDVSRRLVRILGDLRSMLDVSPADPKAVAA